MARQTIIRKVSGEALLPFWIWPFFFLLLWQTLLWAQNPGLMADDSGEMVAAAYCLGLPHPPGYPLFCLLGRIVLFLPVGSEAFRLNLFSELLALVSLGFILNTCRYFLKLFFLFKNSLKQIHLEIILMILALVFVSCRSVFAQSLTSKGCIYTLTLLFSSILIWARVKFDSGRFSGPSFYFIFLLWSIGMANHWQTQILWLPFIVLWFCQAKAIRRIKELFLCTTIAILGFSIYLYLPLRAAQGIEPFWGNPIHLKAFYWIVSRQLVAGMELVIENSSFYFHTGIEFLRIYAFYWLPGFSIFSILGAFYLFRKKQGLFFSIFSFFAPVFFGIFAIHQESNNYLIHDYLLSLAGVVLILGFLGLGWISEWMLKQNEIFRSIVLMIGLSSLAWMTRTFSIEDKNRYTFMDDFGINVLKNLPKRALLLADGDHYVMSIWYEHLVKNKRPDLVFEPSIFLYHNWGWKQLEAQSRDLMPLIVSSDTFQGRLQALTVGNKDHPFCYSLGREYLDPVLMKVKGAWVPHGLVYQWMPHLPSDQKLSKQVKSLIASERFRGLEEYRKNHGLDISTGQIYRYYHGQINETR
jgi:hypothetical protein